jgi:hypothetical protein
MIKRNGSTFPNRCRNRPPAPPSIESWLPDWSPTPELSNFPADDDGRPAERGPQCEEEGGMQRNRVVVHYKDRRVAKGVCNNFFPNKLFFNLESPTGESTRVDIEDLKAVFFTKDFIGDKDRNDDYSDEIRGAGRRMWVEFNDGEVIIGYTLGYSPERQGFFITPADVNGNNERIFVVSSATSKVEFL